MEAFFYSSILERIKGGGGRIIILWHDFNFETVIIQLECVE